MITIHEATATDFTTLGLGALTPTECTIEEKAGGLYELTLVQPFEDDLRHELIRHARIIKAPAPVRETPLLTINATTSEEITREIYKVTTDGRRLNMRTGPGLEYRILHAYKPGTDVVRTEVNGDWAKVIILDGGASGWMWAGNLTYVRSEKETIVEDSPGTVVKPRQTREQLFRICDIEPDSKLRSITVRAQHISYDLKGALVVGNYAPEDTPANVVCAQMVAKADHDISDFNVYCAVTDPVSGDYTDRNILDCLLDPETGVIAQTHARLVRDNYDIFILPGEGRDRGVELRYSKNLLSASMPTGTADIITRIRPVGKDSEGEPLYIEENNGFVDSPRIGEYPVIYSKKVEYDVAVSDDLSIEDARAQLKEKAQAEFEAGCDLPSISVDADFVRLELTEEYKELASAYALHLYDVVSVVDRKAGIVAKVRMTDYEYDGVLNRYKSTGLGDVASAEVAVYGYEIASGSIQGGKIVPNSMNGNRLRDLSVGYAKIDTAAIRQLSADSIVAIRADIRKLVAGEITTDQLYADLATIASAQITAANIEKANIQWAEIETLAAEIATIAQAEITTANIEKANIDWASIDNLTASIATIATAQIANAKIGWAQIEGVQVTSAQIALGAITTALISQGAVGTAQIADGSITSAKIVELTADVIKSGTLSTERLIIKGAGSLIYEINATAGGLTASQLTQEQYKNAISGTALVAKSVTAAQIAAKTITANQIASNTITAAEINVANLFAAQATITALTNYLLKASTIEALQGELDVWAEEKIQLEVSNIRVGGTNLVTGTKRLPQGSTVDTWSATTGGSFYDDDSGFRRGAFSRSDLTADGWSAISSPLVELPSTGWKGRQVTFSTYLWSANWANVDNGISISLNMSTGAKTRTNYGSFRAVLYNGGSPKYGEGVNAEFPLTNNRWIRVSMTFTLDEEGLPGNPDLAFNANTHMFITFWLVRNGAYRFYAPKLEWGNKATDWSPAPEDTEAEFEEVRTEISLTKDAIALKADKTTVNAQGDAIKDIESEMTVMAGNISSKVSQTDFNTLSKQVTTNTSAISQTPEQIKLAVEEIRTGGTQLLRRTKRLVRDGTVDTWHLVGGTVYDSDDGFMRGQIKASDLTADGWKYITSPVVPLPTGWQGRQVTVSAYIDSPNWKAVDVAATCCLNLSSTGTRSRTNYANWLLVHYNSGNPAYGPMVQADRPLANNKWLRVSMTFTLDEATLTSGTGTFDDNTHMYVTFYLRRNGDFRFYAPKLEWGNKATDWSPHPEEFEAGTSVTITKDEFSVTTADFNVNITSEDGTENMLHIDKDGGYMKAFESPTVAPRYTGPGTLYVNPNATSAQIAAGNYYRSLTDAFAALKHRMIDRDVTINLAAGMTEYGTATLIGVNGGGWVVISGNSSSRAKLVGNLRIHHNGSPVRVRYLNVDAPLNTHGIELANGYAEISNCTVTGKGTAGTVGGATNTGSAGIFAMMSASVQVSSCELYDTYRSLYTQSTAEMQSIGNKGNCLIGANRTHIFATGTQPCDSTTWACSKVGGGQVWESGVTVDQGSKPTPEAAPTTVSYSMTNADNYTMGNGSWTNYSDSDIRQGYTTTNGMHRGCFWFDNTTIRSALKGKTIKQATLSLYQMSAGRSQPVQVSLEGITMEYSGRSGVPYGTQEYGVIGTTAGVGVTSTFTIPVKVITDLVAGTINGLMLRNDESSALTGDDNSYHFARFAGGTTTAYKPKLTVMYA